MKRIILIMLYCLGVGNSLVSNAATNIEFKISLQLDVAYTIGDGGIVSGPLSFGLIELPNEVNATFLVNGIGVLGTEGIEIGIEDISSADISFSDTHWNALDNFSMIIDSNGDVSSLSYKFLRPILHPGVAEPGPIILNFPLNITGVDSESGNAFEYQYMESTMTISDLVPILNIDIDIKPGISPNSINLSSNGATPVAILGDSNFDVNEIDTETLSLGSAGVKTVGKKNKTLCHIDDVSGDFTFSQEGEPDGYLDLVCHFTTISIVPEEGSTTSTLKGELFQGVRFEGIDSVNIVP